MNIKEFIKEPYIFVPLLCIGLLVVTVLSLFLMTFSIPIILQMMDNMIYYGNEIAESIAIVKELEE